MIIFLIALLFVVLLEATLTMLPLTLVVLLLFAVTTQSSNTLLFAFIAGFMLDILLLRTIGATSLFFTLFFLLIFLYERKYEIATMQFILFSSFFGSVLYSKLFGLEHTVLQATVGMILAGIVFSMMKFFIGCKQSAGQN